MTKHDITPPSSFGTVRKPFTPDMPQDAFGGNITAPPNRREPAQPPDARAFADPLSFALALAEFAKSNGITMPVAVALYSQRRSNFRREFDGPGEGETR